MPTAPDLPRQRSRRIVGSLCRVLVGIGLIGGYLGIRDLGKGLDAGRWELALSVTFVVVGGLGAFWSRRTMAPAAAADQDAVAARGLRTDLPYGTHDDGDSIGLPSKVFFPAFGLGFLVVCVLLALLVVLDVDGDGRWFSLGFVVMGLVGLFIWWYTHGTVYHVSVEGMWRSRWPRRRVRWVHVTHVGLQRGRAEVVDVAVRTASLQVKAPGAVERPPGVLATR